MTLKTLTVPDWTQADLDRVIAGGAPPLPPAGTLISGVALSSDWNQIQGEIDTAVGNCVPYTGATGPVDLNGQNLSNINDISGVNTLTVNNSLFSPIVYVGISSPQGQLTAEVSGNFDISYYGQQPFSGWNSTSSTPYFGSDPTVYGYGVSYSSNILYVTSSGAASAQAMQLTGAQTIYGDSGSYVIPMLVDDACDFGDASTSSFQINQSGIGNVALDIKNNGDLLLSNSTYQFYASGSGYIGAYMAWDGTGRFRVGGGDPLYGQLESITSSYQQLILGYNNSNYVGFNISAGGALALRPSTNAVTGFQVQNSGASTIFDVDTTNSRVGVNTPAPEYQLDARGTTTSYVQARSSSANSTAGFLLRNDVRFWSIEVYGGIATDDFRIYDQTAGAARLQITGGTGDVGIGVSASDKLTVGSLTNGTNITMGFRTLTSGGSSMRSIFTQNATTGALDLVVDQGQNGSARAFNLTVGGATNAISVSSVGAVTIIAGQSVGSSSAKAIFNASTATNVIDWDINASSTANNTFFRFGNGTLTTASSGISNIISSTPSINQSGTAGYTALNINVTETATGSGTKLLANLAVGGTSRFRVQSDGNVSIGETLGAQKLNVAGNIQWGSTTAFPGYNGYLTTGSNASSLRPAFTRNLIGSTGNDYLVANGELDAYAGIQLGSDVSQGDISFFTAATALATNDVVTPTARMYIGATGNVGIGTTSVSARTHIVSTTEQLRVGYDASNYYSTTVSSAGAVTFDAVGASAGFTFNDSVAIGSGSTPITKVYSATATLDFASIAHNSYQSLTMTVTGAVAGDSVHLGAPAALEAGLTFCGYVSAADTVTITLHNCSGGAVDPASATWRATVMKF